MKNQNNITELVFILDKSGSMGGLESDTVGGSNAMIAKQKKRRVWLTSRRSCSTTGAIPFTTASRWPRCRLDRQRIQRKRMHSTPRCDRGCSAAHFGDPQVHPAGGCAGTHDVCDYHGRSGKCQPPLHAQADQVADRTEEGSGRLGIPSMPKRNIDAVEVAESVGYFAGANRKLRCGRCRYRKAL